MWAGSETDSDGGRSVPSLSESETVQGEREHASCVWCEQKVRLTGQFCSSDCYAFFYAWLLKHQVDGMVPIEEFDIPLSLELQDWYGKML